MRVEAAAEAARCLVGVLMAVAGAMAAFMPQAARAQGPAAFYAGKTVELDIGYSVGGGYDLYGRLLARHLGKHIPGSPTILPKNMEGAGSLRLANYLYMAAPHDGTVIGTLARGIAFDPLLSEGGAGYDATKFSWLGSANNEVAVCVALKSSGVASFNRRLYNRSLTIGANGDRRRYLPVPRRGQCGAGDQVQDRHRLSRRQRCEPCARARRSPRPLRLVMVERDDDPAELGQRRNRCRAGADVAGQTSRSARRAADHGFCQDRRRAADFQADLFAPDHGPAVSRPARPAAGPARRTAQSLRRHHDGQGIPRRRGAK